MALVNPIFVRSVPKTETCKMRVSEMFICGVLEETDYSNLEEVIDFSEEYITQTLEELTEMLSNRTFDKISCQENIPNVSPKDIESIIDILQSRITLV